MIDHSSVSAVLDRRAGQRDAAGRGYRAGDRLGLRRRRVLDLLRLVEHEPSPLHLRRVLDVAGDERVGGEHDVVRAGPLGERRAWPRGGRLPWCTSTESSGAKRRSSRCPVAEHRHRADDERRASTPRSASTLAMSWAVLPRPMSSARQAPRPSRPRNASQPTPRCWYGRSAPANPAGVATGSTVAWMASSSSPPANPTPSRLHLDPGGNTERVEPEPGPHDLGRGRLAAFACRARSPRRDRRPAVRPIRRGS